MGKYCVFFGCKSNSTKHRISFYRFPKPISDKNPIYLFDKQDETNVERDE